MNSHQMRTNIMLNLVKINNSDFKYHFETECGSKYYTFDELKTVIKFIVMMCAPPDIDIDRACDDLLAISLELECKNIEIPESVRQLFNQ